MRTLTAALLALACLAPLAGCDDPDPTEYKAKLKFFESDWLRHHGYVVNHTDEDPRARPPTKYADAAKGVAFALRHALTLDGADVTLTTWVYKSTKARDAALAGPFDDVTGDLRKNMMMFKRVPADTPHMHAILLVESPKTELANQFEMLMRSLPGELPGAETFAVTN